VDFSGICHPDEHRQSILVIDPAAFGDVQHFGRRASLARPPQLGATAGVRRIQLLANQLFEA
jgi:hypothetical protein